MNMFNRTCRVLAFLVLLIAASGPLKGATVTIQVFSDFFQPASPTINVGDTVTWVFRTSGHDTVNKSGSTYGNVWNSGIKPVNSTFSFTFNTAGSFFYVCRPHENRGMVGTITVQGAANTPPTVSLTGPAPGSTFSTTDTITFSANANDPGGSVSRVEFFRGGSTLIGAADTTAPYSVTASLPAGTHSITARATDNLGATATSGAITITVNAQNQAPTVTLTSPTARSTFSTTDTITFSANATDADGSVSRVEFFREGTILIGAADTTAPYSVTATLPAGSHSITARATDNSGATTTTPGVTISVTAPNQAPTVSLTSPANGATFSTTDSITFNANAADADGSVSSVEFFRGGTTLIGVADTTAPFSVTASLPAGTHTITARVTDNSGASTMSGAITITVNAPNQAPTVSLTSPANGTTFSTTDTITFSANAADADGSVSRVEFFHGGATLIGAADTTAPYSMTATLPAGTHTITAKVTDNTGASTTSAGVTITVNAPGAGPVISSITYNAGANTITITASGVNGTSYALEATTDFLTWTTGGAPVTAADGVVTFTDTATQPMRFYRVVAR